MKTNDNFDRIGLVSNEVRSLFKAREENFGQNNLENA